MKRVRVLVIISTLLIVFVMVLGIWLSSKSTTPILTPPSQNKGQAVATDERAVTKDAVLEVEINRKVGELLNKLPFSGKNFSLFYDYYDGSFVLYVNPVNKDAGNQEFDMFLKDNKIERYWIKGLFITYITPTPTPTSTPEP